MRRILYIMVIALFAATQVVAQPVLRGVKSESIVHIDGVNYYIHNVAQGETVYSLSKLYEVAEEDITRNNPLTREGIRIGQVLKIPVAEPAPVSPRRQSKLFEEHTVRAGETAYSIARNYGISLPVLVEDNPGIDPTTLPMGATLNIRKKEMGGTQPWEVTRQWEDYRDAANQVSDEYVYHIVKPGETLYSLARMYGVSQQSLTELNQLQDGLKANGIVRIPVESSVSAEAGGQVPAVSGTAPESARRIDFGDRGSGGGGGYVPRSGRTANIALMLPLEGSASDNSDFVEFYRGALLALEDLKPEAGSVKLTLYNTGRSAAKVRSIVTSPSFSNTNLIIGPVYEDEMGAAVEYAEAYGIPVVSPLAVVKSLYSEMLYQMAPDAAGKYDKMQDILSAGKNIILVSSNSGDDREFETEIIGRLAGIPYGRFTLGGSGDISSLIDWSRENVFVVLAGTELAVDRALASISSAYNNASARHSRRADIKVVGSPRWALYNSNSLDKTLFFKLNVCFVTSYYVDRSDPAIAAFEARFLEAYGDFPSRSAYRGYDALNMFAGALFKPGLSFESSLSSVNHIPLDMPYRFVRRDGVWGYSWVNDQWAMVCFRDDYTIEVR